jgi:hypothetical protein
MVKNCAKVGRAMSEAGVAIDACRHVDLERWVLPLWIPGPGLIATTPGTNGWFLVTRAFHATHRRRHPGTTLGAVPTRHPFLSDAWIAAARAIRDEHLDDATEAMQTALPGGAAVRMNQIITDVPFGDGVIDAHVDTAAGGISLDLGHLEGPDLTVTVDYDTAKRIFIDQDLSMAMQAFMSGRIRVDGDFTKLLMLQSAANPDGISEDAKARALSVAEALKSITAE